MSALVLLAGGLALLGAGVVLVVKGQTETGTTLIVAAAAELGVKLTAGAK